MCIYIAESTNNDEKPASWFLPEVFHETVLPGGYGIPGYEWLWP